MQNIVINCSANCMQKYSKPTKLSIVKIKEFIISSLIQIISFYLPKQDIQEDNILTKEEQITLDATKEILKSIISANTKLLNKNVFNETFSFQHIRIKYVYKI